MSVSVFRRAGARGQLALGGLDARGDATRRGAAIAPGLAAHQVIGLDGGGPLVDGQDLGVAQVLRRAGLLDEALSLIHI